MKNIIPLISFLTLLFAQYEIEGRWHLVGYEDLVMYEFVDTEPLPPDTDAGWRYTLYSIDGNFGDLDDAGGSPNPYSIVDDIITINMFFGTIVNYQMNFRCDGQVVEFIDIDYDVIHSTLFREGFDYFNSDCEVGIIINVPDDYATIQDGIDAASEGDTVLVAAGTYSPSTNNEIFPIEMVPGIHLIGSGEDISIIDAEQTGRVITMEDCDNNTISNLTLTGGFTDSYGGGIRLDYSDPVLINVTISSNTATWGGGIHSCYSNPMLTHVTISNNEALQGGGMRLVDSSPTMTHVTISNNTGSEAGGMRLFGSSPILTHVTINGNTTDYYGGAMWLDYSNPTLNHVTISNNVAEYAGGGMRLSNSNPILRNVTIVNNTAGSYGGGGMYLNSSNPNLTNSIMWGNNPESIYGDSGVPVITFSDIEGGWEGEGNINENPLFYNSENSDYNLQSTSPCIDSGTVIEGMEYCGYYPDMGAYEYCEEELLGDLNDDGTINVQDIILTLNIVLNSEYNSLADLNSDGTIDVLDIVQMINIILN